MGFFLVRISASVPIAAIAAIAERAMLMFSDVPWFACVSATDGMESVWMVATSALMVPMSVSIVAMLPSMAVILALIWVRLSLMSPMSVLIVPVSCSIATSQAFHSVRAGLIWKLLRFVPCRFFAFVL